MSRSSAGMGTFREATQTARQPDNRKALEAEARALLPDESPGLVAGAIQVVRYAGRPVTAENVLARMRACSFEVRS